MPFIGNQPTAVPLTSADITDGIITNADIASGAAIAQSKIAGSFGKVLQVVSTTKTDTYSSSATTFTDVTGMSLSITPSSSSNKVLVLITANIGVSEHANVRLVRGSTNIFVGDSAGSRQQASIYIFGRSTIGATSYEGAIPSIISHLDSPATTSSTTYKLQSFVNDPSWVFNLNRSASDANSASYGRLASSITLLEIAG